MRATIAFTVLAGALLGVVSRVEETQPWALAISTDTTWLALACAVGICARRTAVLAAAAAGALALTVANASYYAWIAATQPATDLAAVAGPPARWFALGVCGGACFALAGWLLATRRGLPRALACVPLAGVCAAEIVTAVSDGPLAGALEALLPGG